MSADLVFPWRQGSCECTVLVEDYLAAGQPLKRTVRTIVKTFVASPEAVFRQFCPSREADWIDGWTADLLYTTSGYVEDDCIFTTPDSNILGPGLWIFTRYEPNEAVELVRIIDNSMVIHFRINLVDNGDGSCTGTWNLKFTALNERGNAMVDAIPEKDPLLENVIDGLQHFLDTGELQTIDRSGMPS